MSHGFRAFDPAALGHERIERDHKQATSPARSKSEELECPLSSLHAITRPVTADDNPADHPEAALIAGLRAGDEGAYRRLYRQYADDVYRLARQFVYGDAEAEEVLQEVFLSAFRYIDRFRGHSRLKTWLYRITVNRALKRRRWWNRRRESPEENVSHRLSAGIGPERRAAGRESLALVESLLGQIEVRKRTVLMLHEIEGLDTRQIAEVLDCPRSTVLTRLSRARHELLALAVEAGLGDRLPEPSAHP